MYKLFLCLRYLKSKFIAYLAIGVVYLLVLMMLVAVSVMTSFLNKIEEAAKGLFGDIVMEPSDVGGMAHYDEFIGKLQKELPSDIDAASPFILTVGMLRLGEGYHQDYRQSVQVAGIRLPDRTAVTDFEDGLFVQQGDTQATFDPPVDLIFSRVQAHRDEIREIVKRELPEGKTYQDLTPDQKHLYDRINTALSFQESGLVAIKASSLNIEEITALKKKIADREKAGASETELEELREKLDQLEMRRPVQDAKYRAIPGLGIPGLSFRTGKGEAIRILSPGNEIVLYIAPLGRELSLKHVEPEIRKFTVIDDNCSGVYSIDDKMVYIPFETAQVMNHMDPGKDEDGKIVEPARCSQIHIKVRNPGAGELHLQDIAVKVRGVWNEFRQEYPDSARSAMSIQTWRERQSKVVGPIESQRVLVIIVLGIMSIAAVAVIFVILYTIVVQKTREIGILKAVGASSGGVAALYFAYGAAISLIGTIFGLLHGWYTVLHINDIHDSVGDTFGIRIFTKETHMFSTIPNEVDWNAAIVIGIGALVSGLLGALIPAIRAARMQPMEALRYE
jgi:lipoprotein-releasing system permease protein